MEKAEWKYSNHLNSVLKVLDAFVNSEKRKEDSENWNWVPRKNVE